MRVTEARKQCINEARKRGSKGSAIQILERTSAGFEVEAETVGTECLTGKFKGFHTVVGAILPISQERMSNSCQLSADLVCAASYEAAFKN